ncbi:molybdenum cofactor guanylyltransferase [Candidatus Pelagibacter sp.]|nr:molybdenum cofactor guanylyltransferase [Candidatus Pelagibacter sp.]
MNKDNILGVVLAGGKSQRFGRDKCQVILGDKTLLDHTLNKVKLNLNKIIIVSNNINVRNEIVIIDCIKGQLGPLVGVLSAMKWATVNSPKCEWIATFPCDTPFFDISIIDDFINASKKKDSLLYFAQSKGRRHNIFGLWSIKLMKTLEEDIVKNNYRKVEDWANKIGVKTITDVSDNLNSFFNINTKEELIEAEKILKIYK